jgi:hypothetical protein
MDKFSDFPQFRKLSNEKAFYKINDARSFEEKQVMGNKVFCHTIKAEKYPEIIRVSDMLQCEPPFELASEEEYVSLVSNS